MIVVLKDVWLEDDRVAEGNFLGKLRSNLVEQKAAGVQFTEDMDPSDYFLTVKAHGRVKI